MARISMTIEAESLADLTSAMRGMAEGADADTPAADKPRRGRPPKDPMAATPPPPPSGDPDLDAPPATPQALANPDSFIAEIKAKLLGKGRDDAIRAKLKELGYEKVRDVPPAKYQEVLAELAKV